MKSPVKFLIFGLLIFVVQLLINQNCNAQTFPISLDTYISTDTANGAISINTNHGNESVLISKGDQWNSSGASRILINFNELLIPAKACNIRLHLYNYDGDTSVNQDSKIQVYRATAPWNEIGVKWNNKPGIDTLTKYDSVIISHSATPAWITLDLTQLVKGWQAGTFINNGFYLYNTPGYSNGGWRGFYSSEYNGNTQLRPYITYSVINLGADTMLCQSTTYQLNAGSGYPSYHWSNGANTQIVNIIQSGNYVVQVTDSKGCMMSDTIQVLLMNVNAGNDTTICKGTSATLTVSGVQQVQCQYPISSVNLQQGLVAYYPLDSNVTDLSGYGNHGYIYGAFGTPDRFGNPNKALRFGGYYNSNFVEVPNSPSLQFTNQMTISFFYKLNGLNGMDPGGNYSTTNGIYCLFAKKSETSGFYGLTGAISSNTMQARFGNTGANMNVSGIYNTFNLANWQHIAYVFTATESKIYTNGCLIASQPANNVNFITANNNNLYFGRYDSYWYPLNGSLDEIRIYNRALNPTEVQSLFGVVQQSNPIQIVWSTGDTAQTITVNPTQTTTYYVTVSNGVTTCFDSVKVYVSNISVNLGNDTTICQGQNLTLNPGNSYTTYQWSTGALTQTLNVLNSGTYSLKVTNNVGCVARDTILVNVLGLQSNIIRDTILCNGKSTVFNPGIGFSNYLWSTGATTPTITVSQPGIYWVNAKSSNGCTIIDSAKVRVDSLAITSLQAVSPICVGGNSGMISSSVAGGINPYAYTWNSTPAQHTANATNLSVGTYTLTVIDSAGCIAIDSATILSPQALQVNIGNDTTICQGQTVNIHPSLAYTTYQWSTGAITSSIDVTTSGTYWLKVINSSGCNGSDTIQLTVSALPQIQINPSAPSICTGETVQLTGTANPSSTVLSWSTGLSGSSINASPVSTQSYTLYGSNNGCKDSVSATVTVKPSPLLSISPSPVSICQGTQVTLIANSSLSGTNYTWSTGASTNSIQVSPGVSTSYSVIGEANLCKDTAEVFVTVTDAPIIQVVASKNPICEGEPSTLTASGNLPNINYTWNTGDIGNTLIVSPIVQKNYGVKGTVANCSDSVGITIDVIKKQILDIGDDRLLCLGEDVLLDASHYIGLFTWSTGSTSPAIVVNEPGIYWVSVNNNGCISTDSIIFSPCTQLWVPNAFTPNGDGLNDLFQAVLSDNGIEFELSIFDRWGGILFHTNNKEIGWDGMFQGQPLPPGVYTWRISYQATDHYGMKRTIIEKGIVSLIR